MLPLPALNVFAFLWIALAFLTLLLVNLYIASRKAELSHVPGPWVARYTDLWRCYQAYKTLGKSAYDYEGLRQKYGDVVRAGPSVVLVFDPAAVPIIFGTGSRLDKGDGYFAFSEPGAKLGALLTIIDEDTHARYKRAQAHAYSLLALKDYEPNVNSNIVKMTEILAKCADNGKVINLSRLSHFFAYDTVGLLAIGRRLGFLDTCEDQSGMLSVQKRVTAYAVVMFHLPWLDRFLKSVLPSVLLQVGVKPFKDFISSTLEQRVGDKSADPNAPKPDMLAHLLQIQKKYPVEMSDDVVKTNSAGALFAGSQSPTLVLDVLFRHLTTSRDIQNRLFSEVGDLVSKSPSPPAFDDVQALPYLDAVIREGYRLHTLGFLFLERMTPAAGMDLPNGTKLPGNIKVAMTSPGCVKRKEIYGDDAVEFNPERWLRRKDESEAEHDKRRHLMVRADLSFGYGSRSCIGKNLVNLEMYKLISTLAGKFEFENSGTPTVGNVEATVRRR